MAKSFYEQKCRICGCDWNHACNDHDYWFAEDLCSTCAEAMKPVLFNTPMVQAILEDRKTNTRRVIKLDFSHVYKAACAAGKWSEAFGNTIPDPVAEWYAKEIKKPPYHPDDILYVRERFALDGYEGGQKEYVYWADTDGMVLQWGKGKDEWAPISDYNWHPSIHMPKEAARIFLRVKDVRVERLQEITNDGARAEGIHYAGKTDPQKYKESAIYRIMADSLDRVHFADLWNSTVKKSDLGLYGWDANPWVWAYKFKRVGNREG